MAEAHSASGSAPAAQMTLFSGMLITIHDAITRLDPTTSSRELDALCDAVLEALDDCASKPGAKFVERHVLKDLVGVELGRWRWSGCENCPGSW